MPRACWAPLALALIAALSCAPEDPKYSVTLLAVEPAAGAALVPEDFLPRVRFRENFPQGASLRVILSVGPNTEDLHCTPGETGDVLDCPPSEPLRSDRAHRLTVDVNADGEVEHESGFTTGMPSGVVFDIGESLEVEQTGGSELAAQMFQEALVDKGTMVAIFSGFLGPGNQLPGDGFVLLGRGRGDQALFEHGQVVADVDEGYTLSIPTHLKADGTFTGELEYAAFPIEVEGTPVTLPLWHLEIRGQADPDGFRELSHILVEAMIPEPALVEVVEAMPEWAELLADLANLVDLDADINDDGNLDACALRISGEGLRVRLLDAQAR